MNSIRLFLEAPYRSGIQHIRYGLGKSEKVEEVALARLSIEPEARPLSMKEKVFHVVLGIGECLPLIGIIVTFIEKHYFAAPYQDAHALIESRRSIPSHHHSWYLNLALLRQAYESAQGKQRELIQFLAANFLNNVTPKHLNFWGNDLKSVDPSYPSKHQGTPLEEYRYHRECLDEKREFGQKYNRKLAYGDQGVFILTDTIDLDHLFRLKFTVIADRKPKDVYAAKIKQILNQHFSQHPHGGWNQKMRLPLLLDITRILDKPIQTNGQAKAEKEFIAEYDAFKKDFEEAMLAALEGFLEENPQFALDKSPIRKFLDENITCIARVQMDGAAGIKMLPIGSQTSKEAQFHSHLVRFVINSGIYMGAVNLRRKTYDLFQQCADVQYGVRGNGDAPLYHQKKDFIEGYLFQRLLCLFGSQPIPPHGSFGIDPEMLRQRVERIAGKPHVKMMGKATIDLLSGLMNEITPGKWNEIHRDPILAQLFQSALFLIREHLAAAELHGVSGDFNRFMQEIELVHAELAKLLELVRPFEEKDFADIYKNELLDKSVPKGMEKGLKVGLGKTGVNIFAGLAALAKKQNTPFQGVVSQGSYYEEAMLMGHYFNHYISQPSPPKLDLYLGQFHSNVDVGSTLTEYTRRDIAADVRKLLEGNHVSDPFTVAVDITIDEFYSADVKNLLEKFEEEITQGKLNFVFFSSGQKFYTLGMDNYYGAYFYQVNNGEEKWKRFDSLFTHPAHRPDVLSAQWFCLATKYAPDGISNYRKLIFANTRRILDEIPTQLQPDKDSGQKLRVNPIKKDVIPCFIDLKYLAPANQQHKSYAYQKKFYEMANLKGINCYSRGSFGFYHHNFSVFGPLDDKARTIRLNPGINPDENEAIIEFFKTLS